MDLTKKNYIHTDFFNSNGLGFWQPFNRYIVHNKNGGQSQSELKVLIEKQQD